MQKFCAICQRMTEHLETFLPMVCSERHAVDKSYQDQGRVKRKIKIRSSFNPDETPCVGCGRASKHGFNYTGSVLSGLAFKMINSSVRLPILGIMHSYDRSYVLGGETINKAKKIGFYTRRKGPLCDLCAMNYHTITDFRGEKHEIVKVDSVQRLGRQRDSKFYSFEVEGVDYEK